MVAGKVAVRDTAMAIWPISNALPSSLVPGPRPPSRQIAPAASLPMAAEPVPATSTIATPPGIANNGSSRSIRTSTCAFGNCAERNCFIFSRFSSRPVPARPAQSAATSSGVRVELIAEFAASLSAANAAGNPIRVGFEAGPLPRVTMAPVSFKTTQSVFVPPPSNPRKHFIRSVYAGNCASKLQVQRLLRKNRRLHLALRGPLR